MKRILLSFTVIFLLITINSSAQIKKGATFLGGNISGSIGKTTSAGETIGKSNGITISPVFGKAIKENLVWGGSLNFNIENYSLDSGYPNDEKQHMYGVGVFLRTYKTIRNSGFYFFMQGGLKVDYLKNDYAFSTPERRISKRYIITANCYPGIAYSINKRWQLETGFTDFLYMAYVTQKDQVIGMTTTETKSQGFNVGTSLSSFSSLSNFYVGFRILLN
ncbi:MAG: hypothetical protein ABI480_15010 [Chitinophagaceae bacterium]